MGQPSKSSFSWQFGRRRNIAKTLDLSLLENFIQQQNTEMITELE